jgi:hypothetical protein
LSFVLREPTEVSLGADVLSLHRPNVIDIVIDGRRVSSWEVRDQAWAFHRPPPVRFRANSGQTVVEFISHEPAESQPADPRRLAFALRNVGITASDGKRLCDLQMGNCP